MLLRRVTRAHGCSIDLAWPTVLTVKAVSWIVGPIFCCCNMQYLGAVRGCGCAVRRAHVLQHVLRDTDAGAVCGFGCVAQGVHVLQHVLRDTDRFDFAAVCRASTVLRS